MQGQSISLPKQFSPNGRCALITLNRGSYFFLLQGSDLCYKFSFDNGRTWSNSITLYRNIHSTFDVTADDEENIYIIFTISKKYSLCLLTEKNDQWCEEIISSYSPASGIPYYPKLLYTNNALNIFSSFICTSLPGAWSIKHLAKKNNVWNHTTLDSGEGLHYNYLAGVEKEDEIVHLVYRFFNEGFYQLRYMTMDLKEKTWEKPILITKSMSSKFAPFFLKDKSNLYVVYLAMDDQKLKLFSVGSSSRQWGHERLLQEDNIKLTYPFLLKIDEAVCCFFLTGEGWSEISLCPSKKSQKSKRQIIELLKNIGEASFMREDHLFKEIKKEIEAELKSIKRENQNNLTIIARLEEEYARSMEEARKMEEELAKARSEISKLEEDLTKSREEVNKLSEELANAYQELSTLKGGAGDNNTDNNGIMQNADLSIEESVPLHMQAQDAAGKQETEANTQSSGKPLNFFQRLFLGKK